MPRRPVGVRSSNWEISTSPDIYDEKLRSRHSLMVESAKVHFDRIDELYERITPILNRYGIIGSARGMYRSYLEELYRAKSTYSGKALQVKANAITSKYTIYGCSFEVLREIAKELGISVEKTSITKTTRLITFGMG